MKVFSRLRSRFHWLFFWIPAGLIFLSGCATRAGETGTIGLDEIKPGQRGVWRTVIQGNEIEEFQLEVVGILQSYMGPEYPIIVCRALDASQRASGPVRGMSGSPVYINGRLAGAYAYGWTWSKNETLIGVTPIDLMMPLYDLPDRPFRPETLPESEQNNEAPEPAWLFDPEKMGELLEGLPVAEAGNSRLSPSPLPLFVSGMSPLVSEYFGDELRSFGLDAIPMGAGSSGEQLPFNGFEPGSAISLVFSSGDIVFGGVGTVTHVQGDRLLAFGHAADRIGSVELAMAPAEIVTIAQRYEMSFKMGNLGQPVGTVWQDHSPGISGQVGRIPYMAPVRVTMGGDFPSEMQGAVAELPNRTAGIFFVYMAQTLLRNLGGLDLTTVTGEMRVEFEGVSEPLEMRYRAVGLDGARFMLMRFASAVTRVLRAPMARPRVASLNAHFEVEQGRNAFQLTSARRLSSRVKEGETIQVLLSLQPELGQPLQKIVEIPVPEGARGERLAVLVQDQATAESFDGWGEHRVFSSFSSLVEELNLLRPNDQIYLRLVRQRPALKIDGRVMEDLPPSVISLYRRSLGEVGGQVRESVVWEKALPVNGTFSGNWRIEFPVE